MGKKAITVKQAARRFGWPPGRMKTCELTLCYSCNARCVFCYSSPDMEAWKDAGSMNLRKAAAHLAASYKGGARMVQFIGGEPTVYGDLPRAVALARRIGFKAIQIVSNGILLADPRRVAELVDAGLNTATLSVHAPRAAEHDAIVGVPGAFDKTLRAARNLIEAGVYLNTGTAVSGINYRTLPETVAFLTGELGVDSCHIISEHYLGAAYKNRKDLRVSYAEQAPYVKKAVAAFKRSGVRPAFAFLSNYLPCVLPGYEPLMGDWKYPELDDDLYLPDGKHEGRMYTMITEKLRMKRRECAACAYSEVCAGFEKKYYSLYGAGEFRPLKTKPRAFPLRPVLA